MSHDDFRRPPCSFCTERVMPYRRCTRCGVFICIVHTTKCISNLRCSYCPVCTLARRNEKLSYINKLGGAS